jgi:hypothetical protein
MGKKYLDQTGLLKMVQSIALQISLKGNGCISSVKSANLDDITVNSTDPANPVIDVSPELIRKVDTLWEIALNYGMLVKEDTPVPVIDYFAEKLANLVPNALYNINGVEMYANSNGDIIFFQSWIGTTINIMKKATSLSRQDSDSVALVIKSRPATPVLRYTPSVKKIFGVNTNMEYKLTSASVWTNCTGNTIGNLINASYAVRVRATSNSFVSAIARTVVTDSFVPVTDITGVVTRIERTEWYRRMIYPLGGLIVPNNATNIEITWSVVNSGNTSPNILNDNSTIECWGTGTLTLQAKITNGLTPTTSYYEIFTIEVVAPYTL